MVVRDAQDQDRRYRTPTVASTARTVPTTATSRAGQEAMARSTQAQALANNTSFWQRDPAEARRTWEAWFADQGTTAPPAPGGPTPLTSGGAGGGSGGGRAGMSLDEIRALANEAYVFDPTPYDQQRAVIANQVAQTNAYNPDFAAMQAEYTNRANTAEAARAAAVQQRLGAIGTLGEQLAGQQAQAYGAQAADLGRAGANLTPFMGQANAMAGDVTAQLTNQGQYLGQLNALSANSLADSLRASGLITQGGQATLANNRGTMLNTLAGQEAQIGVNQANALAANNQNRAQFLAQYGVRT